MTIKLLWPARRWQDNNEPEIDAAGEGVECIFGQGAANVTDEQWSSCHGIISGGDDLNIPGRG